MAITALHNESAIHSMPVAVHLLTAVLLKMAAPFATIQTSTQQWPEMPINIDVSSYSRHAFGLTLMVGISLIQVASTFADGIIKERQVSWPLLIVAICWSTNGNFSPFCFSLGLSPIPSITVFTILIRALTRTGEMAYTIN